MNNTIYRILTFSLSLLTILSCQQKKEENVGLLDTGVSKELAIFRKTHYKDVQYKLFFSLPEKRSEKVTGRIDIEFTTDKPVPFIADFRPGPEESITVCLINEVPFPIEIKNEHLFIPANYIQIGKNQVSISFTAPDQSLNRRDELLYTLLVPDRARTLFPCFDQPDLKSLYTLSLELPVEWEAISNSPVVNVAPYRKNRKTISFGQTEPLSTYLFSFVAGEFKEEKYKRKDREITIYHRETDPKKIAQCPEIASEVFDALEWMEEYTDVPYPFAKYDLIILPGFQYGGMEHTGATLYNDRRMFLNESPTLNERLGRSALIAHETAHMWFGDYVTMQWFDDVWTKEVFANYFASQIVEPLFPDVNHRLNFIQGYIPSAYSEDRTLGSNPVKQQLDNLSNAGLVYGNIIYTKSPVVMEMLVQIIGKEAFRKGIQEYLQEYAYGNADWSGLIRILDQHTSADLVFWSQSWINEKGMPEIAIRWEGDQPIVTQQDPFNRGILWPQEITYTLYTQKRNAQISISLDEIEKPLPIPIEFKGNIQAILPNTDGKSYGFFRLSPQDAEYGLRELQTIEDEVLKGSLLITLYENLLHGTISPEWFTENLLKYVERENNTLLFSAALGYIGNCQRLYPAQSSLLEAKLWNIVLTHQQEQHRLPAFRLYTAIAHSEEAIQKLYSIWNEQKTTKGCHLSENDYINLSYTLALHLPEQAEEILRKQQDRITNPDRKREYAFISPAVSPNPAIRDSVFNALLIAENRRIEPWASTALAYLNHHTRQKEAIKYIRPALNKLQEVQRTGDIFFPTAWVRALLSGHQSPEAWSEIENFFQDNPNYPTMLSNKINQQADFLYRSNSINE